jgi:hypothetical protein
LTAVAPIVRFNAFDILVTPVFFFASTFSSRTSDEVQGRRATFSFFIFRFHVCEPGFYHTKLVLQRATFAALNTKSSMTNSERAALVRDQYDAGLTNGQSIARIVIKRFPDGFTTGIGAEIRAITDSALAHVIDTLTINGVEERYIRPFKLGFRSGLNNTFSDYADDCMSRALRISQVG